MGWNWNTGGLWRISSYYDFFRFPWLRYRADAPTFGQDAMLQADYAPSSTTKMYIQARYKEKEENVTEPIVNSIASVKTTSAKMVFSHQFVEGFGIGNHLEVKNYRKEDATSKGFFLRRIYTLPSTPSNVIRCESPCVTRFSIRKTITRASIPLKTTCCMRSASLPSTTRVRDYICC